jgi:drug/metabolite transporter (DMT)-like permease
VGAAFAISSLNLVAVLALSHLLLKEEVDRTRWIGVLMILAGVSLVIVRI